MSDNPSAFPCAPSYDAQGFQRATGYEGMTLRDYFAGQALAGLCADSDVNEPPDVMARSSYGLADAMLAARTGDA